MQEAVLGIGGWRLLESLGIPIDICHLNEGHAALAVLERALSFKTCNGVSFHEALMATRAGNIFTTHTPVESGFDRYSPALLSKYFAYIHPYLDRLEISIEELLALEHIVTRRKAIKPGSKSGRRPKMRRDSWHSALRCLAIA